MSLVPDQLFHALSDATRLRALILLHELGELCVCEITHALAMPQPKISRHLAMLREGGLVSDRREGLWIHYRLHPELPAWAKEILAVTARANGAAAPYARDRKRLATMTNRPPVRCCA
jgi:ArsR family transcriptional regulator